MRLAGLQKLTLLDYPGEVACTVFTKGCNLRCPFCQNPGLVLPELLSEEGTLSEEEFFSFLERRKGRLSAVTVTGGEPTVHPDLPAFLSSIQKMGYLVKLDTNGLNPEMLSRILDAKLADYVAMDVKNSPGKYALTCGIKEHAAQKEEPVPGLWEQAKKSIALLRESPVKGEFRTTVVSGLHTIEDIRQTARFLAGLRPWFLQQFREGVEGGSLVGTFQHSGLHLSSPSWKDLDEMKTAVQDLVPNTEIRGI